MNPKKMARKIIEKNLGEITMGMASFGDLLCEAIRIQGVEKTLADLSKSCNCKKRTLPDSEILNAWDASLKLIKEFRTTISDIVATREH